MITVARSVLSSYISAHIKPLPPIVRVDVAFEENGRAYCNEIEIMPSFYFNVPIVSINDPSGTERNARFQVQVAEAIAAFLKNQKE